MSLITRGAGPLRATGIYLWDRNVFHKVFFYTQKLILIFLEGKSVLENIIIGLTSDKAKELQIKYGKNQLTIEKKETFFHKIIEVIKEPMFILLMVAAVIYFILGEPRDGAIMLVFVVGIISIDVIQEWKTDKTLKALKDLSAPHIKVIRDGNEILINSCDLVPNDLMLISEGVKIPADGVVIRANDLCVDESSLTGEALGVWKVITEKVNKEDKDYWRKDYCYAGTLVTSGSATILVDKIGLETEYGKIGANVANVEETITPLQRQTGALVKLSAVIAAILFAFVAIITFFNILDHILKDRIIESILSGITLSMAMIPEEFPVILTVFLSMGAWRLAKKQSLVRKLPSVETLGMVSVLCVDKTGTITLNKMTVKDTFPFNCDQKELSFIMGLGCETNTYDPMEKAMLSHCEQLGISKETLFSNELVKEYSFTNETKIMGHIWKMPNEILVAAKGSPEKIISLCNLSYDEEKNITDKITQMSKEGLRVIAVAKMSLKDKNNIPETLLECKMQLCGIVGLADPPRETIKDDIKRCSKAGVRVVMITGDNGITASSIAKQIKMPNCDEIITGDELNKMSDEQLREKVKRVNIFSRVIPEHKMRIVKAFKENGQVVAMTGDGVNDAPALKNADIGIAMGKRGSQVSREAADLILLDDNFSTIVDTIKDGRRIYDNIRKAIGYVFTIHIPIALASLFAPLLKIEPALLMFLPLHIVLLELVIDPTCSIVLERQPAEKDIMERPPRKTNEKILNFYILAKSFIQGLVIFATSFGTYFAITISNPENQYLARTMGLCIILLSNIFLVQVNSSNSDFFFVSFNRLKKDRVMWIANGAIIFGLLIMLYTPLSALLKLTPLSFSQLALVAIIAFASVMWFEIVKLVKYIIRNKHRSN